MTPKWQKEHDEAASAMRAAGKTDREIAEDLSWRFEESGLTFTKEGVRKRRARLSKSPLLHDAINKATLDNRGDFYPILQQRYADIPAIIAASPNVKPLASKREVERLLLVGDVHTPYHDPKAWGAMLRFARQWAPNTVVQLGDLVDCYTISRFRKDPKRRERLVDEINAGNERREELESLGAERHFYTEGNHEYRWVCFIGDVAPQLDGVLPDMPQLLGFRNGKWQVTPYMQHATIGKLNLTHDTKRCGKDSMRLTGMDFCASVAYGHSHCLGAYYFGDVLGGRHVSLNVGWLGDPEKIDYEHRIKTKDHQHGFAIAYMRQDGTFQAMPIPIVDGKVVQI